MVITNKFAIALAVIGSGAVLSACGAEKQSSHVTQVPAASGKQASGSCGAAGGCGAAKEEKGEAQPVEMTTEPTEAAPVDQALPTDTESEPAVAEAPSSEPTDPNAAAPATSKPATPLKKKSVKKAGAQGGCGQGSCA